MPKGNAFIRLLQNPIIAFILVVLALLALGWLLPEYWIFGFTAIFTYLLSDILLSLIIKGGNGIAIIPAINNQTKHKGHAYLAFFVGMIFATVVSGLFNDFILMVVKNSNSWMFAVFLASIGLSIGVFADLQSKFYAHNG